MVVQQLAQNTRTAAATCRRSNSYRSRLRRRHSTALLFSPTVLPWLAYISSQPTKPAKAVNSSLPRLAATNYCSSTAQCVLREGELQARRGAPAAPELSGQVELSDAVLRWTVHAKVLQYRSVHVHC